MSINIRKQLARIFNREYRQTKSVAHTVLLASIIAMSNVGMETAQAVVPPGQVEPKQVGQAFTITVSDLAYILKQIKIAEAHVAANNPDPVTDPDNCKVMLGNGLNQINSPLLSFGLRTVNGACNNLQPFQDKFGAADQVFPRLTTPNFERPADTIPPGFPGAGSPTNYNQKGTQVTGNPLDDFVFDSQPRTISNLIVDQTSSNPAAVYVAAHPARAQANPDVVVPCTAEPTSPGAGDGVPAGCTPAHETLFIPNITTDVGLSPPFNSLFTIFGQFFDHGLDKITNGGNGQVFVPLKDDDPLVAGPDHIFGNADDLSADKRFMVITRGTIKNDPVTGIRSAPNTDTPFVDQSQTYTSHSSHQVFLREYKMVAGKPVATGKFLSTTDGGMANWKMIKDQAATMLGLQLVDVDVNNIPMVAADQYGNFIPGPNGLPQYVTDTGLVEGDLLTPVLAASVNAKRIDTAFLNDIAHSAGPGNIGSAKNPDADSTAGGSLDPVAAGEYDDELLDLHYICGDGRCNENIGLTAIHQIFHMEHDRLVDNFYHEDGTNVPGPITGVLVQDPALLAEYKNVNLTVGSPNKTFTFEERLFQAARFVTEMQYQHLVFEEFARKVQPAINPFQAFAFNQTGLNPAITAEFAHAVYRFGHSMLTETLPRINADGSHNDIDLLAGFLNPAAFNDGGPIAGHLNDRDATGSLIMGLSDQTGNEIDEFVTEVLRNHLLGLPLDLPSVNMARARSEGIPSLNNVRKQIFAATNDAQMVPYANWVDYEQNLKHSDDPERSSLVNFIAAYGKHPTILAETTLAGKRAAAKVVVNGGVPDSADFLFSTGVWANVGGVSKTGVDDIDLWVGGLAENTNLFGGLLGSTFNYVFEKQLTDLQNGDRLYYLARTPGMNLRTQLEGNSFSELVMRNTVAHTLKADPFATADCKFQLAHLDGTVAGFVAHGSTVADDPATECDESLLLIRMPDGTIKYRATNSVDPVGINGQSVYNGTDFADEIYGGNDNDTFWGGLGNDTINGGGGDDIVLGGEGDDIITDFAGADILKGGPGNDAIDGGPGDDILMPGFGKDFSNGGANINETFASEGDDFAIAGQGEDAVFGDGGDDWEEGGDQPDLLIGDNSSLFFDDHNKPGHDILIGQDGDDDYDMEGGDDIGVSGPGVEKIAGGAGFDWEIGISDPQPQVMDLDLPLLGVPLPINAIRDRFNEVEALSGWKFDDTLRGDSIVPTAVGGGGFIGCDALDADGVARIVNLDKLIPASIRTVDPAVGVAGAASINDSAVTNYCGLEGLVWGDGNILLGGEGSDKLEGRGANDILDGDSYLSVRLSVRAGVDANGEATGAEIGSTNLMENSAVTGNFGTGTEGMTLQQAVFAGKVNPGQIVAVREVLTPTVPADCGSANPVNCDTALFSGVQTDYTFVRNTNPIDPLFGSVTVVDSRGTDGVDTLWNIEQVSFCLTPGAKRGTCEVFGTPVALAPPLVVDSPTLGVTITGSRVFGTVPVGTSSVQVVTLKNTGSANIIVSGMSLTGVDAGAFGFSPTTCGTVAPAGSCDITVTFTPTTAGAKSATLVINHNGPTGTSTVDLSGTGGGNAPIAAVSLTSLAFASVNIGGVPGTQAVTVKNTGNADLVVSSATVTGDNAFSVSANTCGTVAPNGTCSVTVSFLPTTVGAKAATLDIAHNAAGSSTSIPMTGTGTSPGTGAGVGVSAIVGASAGVSPGGTQPPVNAAKLSLPTALDFGTVKANANKTMAVTVTNQLNSLLHISFVNTTGGAFSATRGGCPVILGVGKSCKIRVTFNPTVPGKVYTGKLKLSGSNPMTMSLSGTGRR